MQTGQNGKQHVAKYAKGDISLELDTLRPSTIAPAADGSPAAVFQENAFPAFLACFRQRVTSLAGIPGPEWHSNVEM